MKKGLKILLITVIVALNVAAILHSKKSCQGQEASMAVKPLRVQMHEAPFVLFPAWFKA